MIYILCYIIQVSDPRIQTFCIEKDEENEILFGPPPKKRRSDTIGHDMATCTCVC